MSDTCVSTMNGTAGLQVQAPRTPWLHTSSSSKQRPCPPKRLLHARYTCIHKEYARQGSAAAQHDSGVSSKSSTNAGGAQQLLSVPEDIVLECLTILRCVANDYIQPFASCGVLWVMLCTSL